MTGEPLPRLPGSVLVRVSDTILEKLATEGSEPVVILGVEQQDDGTYDMTLKVPELLALGDQLAAAVEERWTGRHGTCECACCVSAREWKAARSHAS